jgi:hypothetical protein
MAETNCGDPRNVKRRVFTLRTTFQGIKCEEEEWDVATQADLDEFKAEVVEHLQSCLDGCLSHGEWGFAISSYEPIDQSDAT